MRLQIFTSALAAASFLGTRAAAQDDGYITSASTYTIYKTVERVVETAYATMSSSAAAVDTELPHEPTQSSSMMAPVASASMAPLPHYNGTARAPSGLGGALPSSTVSVVPQASGNSAVRFGPTESYAFVAIAGIIALAVL